MGEIAAGHGHSRKIYAKNRWECRRLGSKDWDMFENLMQAATNFTVFDVAALTVLLCGWFGMGVLIERDNPKKPSTHSLMRAYRIRWMEQMVTREPRIFDISVLSGLRQAGNFFASACMLSIGGGVALLGQADRLAGLAKDISSELAAPLIVWEAKIMLILVMLAYALLKFIWSIRLFGYCAVVMASTPNDAEDKSAYETAHRAAKLNIYAARSFNRGLRGVYFSLAALAWLLGPLALFAATVSTIWMLYRREFNSLSRSAILED